jgi:hypothetical protein
MSRRAGTAIQKVGYDLRTSTLAGTGLSACFVDIGALTRSVWSREIVTAQCPARGVRRQSDLSAARLAARHAATLRRLPGGGGSSTPESVAMRP